MTPDFKIYKGESKTKYTNRLMSDSIFLKVFKTKVSAKIYVTKMFNINKLEIKARDIKKGIDELEKQEKQDIIDQKTENDKTKGLIQALLEKVQEFLELKKQTYKEDDNKKVVEKTFTVTKADLEVIKTVPKSGESQDDFMSRCMSDPGSQQFDQDQRLAVCFAKFKQ